MAEELQQPSTIEPDAFYTAKDLARRWRIHEITVWRWAAQGRISKPVKLGKNTSRWTGSSILETEQRLAAE